MHPSECKKGSSYNKYLLGICHQYLRGFFAQGVFPDRDPPTSLLPSQEVHSQ